MDTLKLSELIGQEIAELRFHYIPENECGLESFSSYIKLKNDIIIGVPKFSDDNDYMQLTDDNVNYYKKMFDTGELVNEKTKLYFVGQKIVDFYFSYFNNEVDIDISAFIKLTNNFYLSENNSGPHGVTDINLIILDEEEFNEEVKRLKGIEVDVRSFIMTKNAC